MQTKNSTAASKAIARLAKRMRIKALLARDPEERKRLERQAAAMKAFAEDFNGIEYR